MSMVSLNGIDIHHEVHGDPAGEWVLNIGGSGGDLRRTLPDRSPLNRRFRVLQYDQRGLGRTSIPPGPYTMADYADDAAALIEHVVDGPCHVVGTSFGGMVALHLAVRRPDLVRRLALLCTSPGGSHPSAPLHELADMDPDDAFRTRMRQLDTRWDPDADEPIPDLGPVYDVVAAPPELSDDAARGARLQLLARRDHDVVDRLGEITAPTLAYAGRYDGTAPVANSEVIVDAVPDARLEIAEAGHLLMFQDREVMSTVIAFLAGDGASPGRDDAP